MTPDQLEAYGLPESFADYNLIVRSIGRRPRQVQRVMM